MCVHINNKLKLCCKNAIKHGETVCPNCGEYLTQYYMEMQQKRLMEIKQNQR